MKTRRTIQKIAVAVGMSYGLWLGTNVNATDADSRNAFVIIALSAIIAISLMPDKTDSATVKDRCVQQAGVSLIMRKRPAPRCDAGACTNKREKFLIMEMFGKTLCITFDELVRSGIMSKSNFDKHVRERKFQVLQKGGNGRKVLVAYETLSDALRSVVEKKLPDIKKQLKKGQTNPMNIRLKSDDKAVEFYKTYTPKISIDRQKEYVLNAKEMNAMIVQ